MLKNMASVHAEWLVGESGRSVRKPLCHELVRLLDTVVAGLTLPTHLFIVSACLSYCLPACLPACLRTCPPVCLSVCLSVYLFSFVSLVGCLSVSFPMTVCSCAFAA